MAEWEQWEAVQGPRSHCGLSSSVTRCTGAHGRFGAWWHLWKACNLPATYDKMDNPQECEEISKWHMAEWKQWECRTGTQVTLWGSA
ncbi:unnamed protein product, partial [Staurois parvus]